MEGLAVAAGLTGVLTFAIQSTKVIRETLSGIKDVPAEVERLIAVISNLRFLLEELEELWTKNDDDGGNLSKNLELVISTCAFDLDQFRKQVCRLQVLPDKKTWRRTWRNLKSVMLEKEKLNSMRMVILHHHSALQGHLSIANYKSYIDHRKNLAGLLTETMTSSREASSGFNSFIQNFQTATTQNVASFKSISKQTADHRASQKISNQASESLRNDILVVKESAETRDLEIQKRLESTSQSLDSLSDKVHRLSIGFSEGQIKALTSMITSLQSQILSRDPKDCCSTSQREDCDAHNTEDSRREDDVTETSHRLTSSLRRLVRIAKDARTVAPSQEARSVLEALETILDLMVDGTSVSDSSVLERKRADDFDSMNTQAVYGQEQRRIKGLLTTSQSLILNPEASDQNRSRSGHRAKRLTRSEIYKSRSGILSIVSMSQIVANSHYHQDAEAESSCQNTLQKYAGKATFLTTDTAFPYKMSATVLQNLTCSGYYSLKPTLSYHAKMPFESEVLVTVRTGNLLDLKILLRQGKASLTDCDPAGRSLLSYASYYGNPDICEYLIENGADLDSLEPSLPNHNSMTVPLLYYPRHSGRDPSRSGHSRTCYRLMLLAGSDPLIDIPDRSESVLSYLLDSGTSEDLQEILFHASVVIDPEELVDTNNCTMLLSLCGADSSHNFDKVESLKLLLKFGVNVNATDKYGNTAIHLFFASVHDSEKDNIYVTNKNFLVLLLQSIVKTGADLHAKNQFGIEASHVAYGHLSWDPCGWNFLYLRTQLWNEVLAEFGFDIAEFRSCQSGCQCSDRFRTELFCDWFEQGAYLENNLCPEVASKFFVENNSIPKQNANFTPYIFEISDSTDEEGIDSEVKPENYNWLSNQDQMGTTTVKSQEPNIPATADTRSKTFWNVI